MGPRRGARTRGGRFRAGVDVGTGHDSGVRLSLAEQRGFEEIVAPMWTLRLTRGRRSSIFGRDRTCLVCGVLGIVCSVVALGTSPLAVAFAGFVLALVAFDELSQHAAGSGWWQWTRRSLGWAATLWELLVVVAIVASAFVVRSATRRTRA